MHKILIVDDEKTQREALAGFLEGENYVTLTAERGEEGIKLSKGVDLVLLDLKLPDMDGLEVLSKIKEEDPEIEVIMLTAYGTIETAVSAIKRGAFDYLTKPIDLEKLLLVIKRALEKKEMEREIRFLREELVRYTGEPLIIAESNKMKEVLSLAVRVAQSSSSVLLYGESGTGKELLARAIHYSSPRRTKRFVAISCAALPETLLESELFGYEKGAFTGAVKSKPGKFEVANGGTLFLDEIGDIPLSIQVKLLRVLQEREIERLGSNEPRKVDVRIISATNQKLEEKIKEGKFREDLYYRLNVVTIEIPPLRERKEDIIPLANHFLEKFKRELGKPIEGFTREARELLLSYNWPGNVRELQNVIERAVVLTRSNLIGKGDLPLPTPREKEEIRTLEDLERKHIERVLRETGWNINRASQILGIHRNTLRLKIRKYGISKG
jgi:two-component system NtrC family response regulator